MSDGCVLKFPEAALASLKKNKKNTLRERHEKVPKKKPKGEPNVNINDNIIFAKTNKQFIKQKKLSFSTLSVRLVSQISLLYTTLLNKYKQTDTFLETTTCSYVTTSYFLSYL